MQPTKTSERGITLIALLISIIIMVILTAVVIRSITGDEPIIGTTAETAEDYKIVSYKEEISHVVHSEIISKSAIGETATTGNISDALNEQDWVKIAYVNADATAEVGNITVQVNEGYVYQVYYNSIYGKIEIECTGKDVKAEDLNSFTLTVRYEKTVTSIFATAEDKKKGISKLELIYKDQVVRTVENPTGEQSWNIEEIGTGWYKVKATSNNGATKYTLVKVANISEELTPPEIILTPVKPKENQGWYKEAVTVEIKYNKETAKEVHYRIIEEGTAKEENEDIKYEAPFTINNNNIFRTEIYAWTIDETEKYQSEERHEEIKIDTKAPTVDYEASSTESPINNWYKGDVTIKVTGEDEGSGIKEYLISRNAGTTWEGKKMNEEIKITEEGTTNIQVKTKDIAGNESTSKTITIQKDITPPEKPTVRQTGNTANSITVEAIANDNAGGSGIAQYKFEIKPISGTDNDWTSPSDATINSVAGTQSYTFTGLNMGEYSIRVTVKDKAGNKEISVVLAGETVTNSAPTIEASYYTKDTNYIKIKATGKDNDGDLLTYKLYVSTDGENWGTEKDKAENKEQNTQITLTANNLSEYTPFYWKVNVTDGNIEEPVSTGTQGTIRTSCSGNTLLNDRKTHV